MKDQSYSLNILAVQVIVRTIIQSAQWISV